MPRRKSRLLKKQDLRNRIVIVSVGVLVAVAGYIAITFSHASSCTLSATLVNPCRPLIGAAARGNPGAPSDAISQFNYLDTLTGQHMDVFRDYHSPLSDGNGNANLPLDPSTGAGQAEISLAKSGVILDINWDVTHTWKQAMSVSQGGDPTINSQIDQAAANIKKLPYKVFLSPWHEANLHIGSVDNSSEKCSHFNATDPNGTPDQFVAAWQNIYAHFQADGVTNVVWVLNFGSYGPNDCWVPYMWPGNSEVDWVIVDSYSSFEHYTWDQSAGNFYTNVLAANSTSTRNFDSKPWGLGEFGDCNAPTPSQSYDYFNSITAAVKANSYPNFKMYLMYADTGNGAGPGCLSDYDPASSSAPNGTKDTQKEADVNAMFSAIVGSSPATPTPTHTPTPVGPTPTPVPPTPTPTTTPGPGPGGDGGGSGGSTSSGTLDFGSGSGPTQVSVNGQTVSDNGQLNTTYLTNGMHTVTVDQNGKKTSETIDVHNKLNPFEAFRNYVFAAFIGHPAVMNAGAVIVILLVIGAVVALARSGVMRWLSDRRLVKKSGLH